MSAEQVQQFANAATSFSTQVNATLKDKEALRQIEKDREFNRVEAEKARNWSTDERLASQAFELDMWNKNNEYNSPLSQLKRLKEAGINPNSLGGNPNVASSPVTTSAGSPSQASNSSGASYVAPAMSMPASMLTAIGNYQNQISQSRNTDVKTDWDSKTFEERAKQVSESTKEIESRYKLNYEQTKQVAELNNWVAQKSKAELDLILAQLNTEKERKELVDAQTYTEIAKDGLIEEQISGQQTENDLAEIALSQDKLKAQFSKITGIPYDADDFQLAYYLWNQDQFEDYIYFVLSKGATDNGSGILKDVLGFFNNIKSYKNPRMSGKRTTTTTVGPKGTTLYNFRNNAIQFD